MRPVKPIPKLTAKKGSPISLRVGELLVKEGFIKHADLSSALKAQQNGAIDGQLPIGNLMVQKKLISQEQLRILANHPDLRKNLGTLLL